MSTPASPSSVPLRDRGAAPGVVGWVGVTFDCVDAPRVADFWSRLLGRPIGDTSPGWVYLGHPGDDHPRLVFQTVPEPPPSAKLRTHLDVAVTDLRVAEATVVRLGGAITEQRTEHAGGTVVVAADPEGHPFCLVWYRG